MTVFELILAIFALIFGVLVIFLALLVMSMRRTLKQVDDTLTSVKRQIDSLGPEPRTVLLNANDILSNINFKLKALDQIFIAISDLSTQIKRGTEMHYHSNDVDKTSDIIDLTVSGLNLWKKLKKRS